MEIFKYSTSCLELQIMYRALNLGLPHAGVQIGRGPLRVDVDPLEDKDG
jgi:hypothetical protein